ncbi:MAG: hypothetical protein QF898_06205 [SAR202 cluster bacterium]|jgi:hypothetical protein|nr:hypothetical protein [SAR202 cluster bacterium]MDP6714180.1 hypothetical protein [SAR202 cluster bacterium]
MKKLGIALATGMAMLAVAITAAMALPSDNMVEAKKKDEAVLEFSIGVKPGVSVGKIVDAVRKAANIGSSGQDGFQIDSFFDIEYRIDFSDDGRASATVDIEIRAVPNSPDLNPGTIIDNVRIAVADSNDEYTGHVTVLK